MLENILPPVIAIGSVSLIFGALLGFTSKKFAVKLDPIVEKIRNLLPGVNCGGCGYAGCAVFAEAVAKEDASYKGCPVGGAATANAIAEVLGIDPVADNRRVAFVKCSGKNENVKRNYIYDGPRSCVAASQLATGGNKACTYGCLGLASCKNVCPFDAIKIVDSIAIVDSNKCTACGKCATVCPKNLIEIVPDRNKVRVECQSKDKGRVVRINCRAGCIGCTLCQTACKFGAITVENNVAHVDYEKCTMCMECVDKCPSKVIKVEE